MTLLRTALLGIPSRRMRILVEIAPGAWRYIAKIIPYANPDGGFAVVPAYQGHEGYITKLKLVDTFSHLIPAQPPRMFDGHAVSHRVKLSFHSDGATQISAADITTSVFSGRDTGGDFKGVGVLGHPFSRPVNSGSVFSLTAWGLHHYRKTDIKGDAVRFSRLELGRRGSLGGSAFLLKGFLIKKSEDVEVVNIESDMRIRSVRWNGTTGRKELMELRVINLRNHDSCLAISCRRTRTPTADGHPSGYMMSGQRSVSESIGIHVFFPRPNSAKFYRTLDRGIFANSA